MPEAKPPKLTTARGARRRSTKPAARIARTDHAGFLDGGVVVHQRFHLGRPDLVAAGVDHAFQAVGHEEVAVLVHAAEVAGAQEAHAVDGDQQKAIVVEAEGGVGYRKCAGWLQQNVK